MPNIRGMPGYTGDDSFERLQALQAERGGKQVQQQSRVMQPTQAAKVPSRMQLTAVTRGKINRPLKTLLYGVEGVGKTTFAAMAPDTIFIAAEDGTAQLDVARFPEPRSWQDVLDAIEELTTGQHSFKTLAIDTLDWLEPVLWAAICKRDGQRDIESYGYGKGYTAALDEWRVFLAALERMCSQRSMGVIMLAHSWVKPFKNPEGEDFDRYEMKLNNKAAGLLKEWCDTVLFARYETFAVKDQKTKRVRGVSSGARVVHTVRTAAYDAKNRHDLPETMPLDYEAYAEATVAKAPADAATLTARIEQLLVGQPEEFMGKVNAAVVTANGNPAQLARVLDRLTARLNIAAEQTQENAQ